MFGRCTQHTVDKVEAALAAASPAPDGSQGAAVLDMETEFLNLGLDIIGLGVFNYEFGSITSESPVIEVGQPCPCFPVFTACMSAEGLACRGACDTGGRGAAGGSREAGLAGAGAGGEGVARGGTGGEAPRGRWHGLGAASGVPTQPCPGLPCPGCRSSSLLQAVYGVLKEAEHRSTFYIPYWNLPLTKYLGGWGGKVAWGRKQERGMGQWGRQGARDRAARSQACRRDHAADVLALPRLPALNVVPQCHVSANSTLTWR